MALLTKFKNVAKRKLFGQTPWEESISLNSFDTSPLKSLPSAISFFSALAIASLWSANEKSLNLSESEWMEHIGRDPHPVPMTADREGYYGENHLRYWASGLREMRTLTAFASKQGVQVDTYLDIGCATGRVLRHFACQRKMDRVCGVDLNRRHIDWIAQFLPGNCEVAQTTSIPHLPFEDNSFDLVSAFSVFTHIEAFETAWLMEIKRILRPGGLAWITIHSEHTWQAMEPGWPLFDALTQHPDFQTYLQGRSALPQARLVFRTSLNRSYSSNVFYTVDYTQRVWGRILEPVEVLHRCPDFQDVVVFRKKP